jgi:hypothetical protein
MALMELHSDRLEPVRRVTFSEADVRERQDLQRLLRDRPELLLPDVLILAEEFGHWQDSRRRIDLLGVDRDGKLVVIELKRTEDGGHMELQALRYAAMVSTMTWRQAVDTYARHLASLGRPESDAESLLLEFLGWAEPDEAAFGSEVRIVLVSGDFHQEITTTVMWLNSMGLDITCIRMALYELDGRLLVDLQPLIPLPEARDYQVRVREKERLETVSRSNGRDWTRFDLTLDGVAHRGLKKRIAVLTMVRFLTSQGITPEAIAEAVPWRKRLWRCASGHHDERSFIQAINLETPGRSFDAGRYFTASDELIRVDGSTYAVSNQWGTETQRALEEWAIAFSDSGIQVTAAGALA